MRQKGTETDRIVDIHSHILPALDDGSRDLQETLAMLPTAEQAGITDIIATPHYKAGRHNAGPDTIRRRLEEVQEAARREGISVRLYAGNEIHYFSDLEEALEEGKVCTMNHSRYVLIEFSPSDPFRTIRNAMDMVMGIGFWPILAHAERYGCMLEDWRNAEYLKSMGAEIQINASSVAGQTGRQAKKLVRLLLDQRLVDYISTDAHDSRKRTPDIQKCRKILYRKYDVSYVNEILCDNAQKLLYPQEE